jgi:hypothetical protein
VTHLAQYPALKPWFPQVIAGEWAAYWVFANWPLALTVVIAVVLTVCYVLYVVCFMFFFVMPFILFHMFSFFRFF